MAKGRSNKGWLQQHVDDYYVKMAQSAGYRSRAAFKLEEIDKKDRLIKPGTTVVDLGAAPGAWSQYVVRRMGGKGWVIALDILPMVPLDGVKFIQGDFRQESVLDELNNIANDQEVALVLSDMAPNITGVNAIDQPSSIYLAELALEFALMNLNRQGCFLVKVFQGEGFDQYVKAMRDSFKQVATRKPAASRSGSREVYLLGRTLINDE